MSSTARAASASRKHVMESVLTEFPLPNYDAGQRIGRLEGSQGGNLFAASVPNHGVETGLEKITCRLPSRFLNKIWVKRGDFVIVDTEDTIVSVLYPKQIAHIRSEHLWPSVFPAKDADDDVQIEKPAIASDNSDDGDDSDASTSEDEIFQNPNRRRAETDSDDSSSEEDDDDDD